MTALRPVLFLLAFLGASLPASGHDNFPKGWCADPKTTPVIVAEFNFEKRELIKLEAKLPQDKCGIVDLALLDPYHSATHIAHNFCAAQAPDVAERESGIDAGDEQYPGLEFGDLPIPMITSPETYNDPSSHHASYAFTDGLDGVCVICVPIEE